MPYIMRKLKNGFYSVMRLKEGSRPGHVFSYHTTKNHAEAQIRLLRGVEYGMKVRKNNRRRS